MKKAYQVNKAFEWGSFKLHPLEDLTVTQADSEDCLTVSLNATKESILVGKKAFQNHLNLGLIVEK